MNVVRGGGNQPDKTYALFYICSSEVFCMIHTHCTHFLPPFSPMHSRIAVCSLCVQPLFDTRQQNTIWPGTQLQFSSTFSRLKRGCLHVFKDTFILSSLNNLGKAIKCSFSPWCWQLLDWRDGAQKYRFHGCLIELSTSRSLFAVIFTMMLIWWYGSDRVV